MNTASRRILHVTADFPDSIEPAKTPVIRSLIDLTAAKFDHEVYSLNRRNPEVLRMMARLIGHKKDGVTSVEFDYGRALAYRAPPLGLLHRACLRDLGLHLADEIGKQAVRPDLLLGHKLTIEGVVVLEIARALGLPYAITIQSHTDDKIIRWRPDLRALFGQIFHGASMVFAFSPVAYAKMEAALGARSGPMRIVPCPTDLDTPQEAHCPGNGLVSVFHLKNHRIKNLDGMVRALAFPLSSGSRATLDVIGGGSESDFTRCRAIAHHYPGVRFTGPLDRMGVQQRLSAATAFIMPSRSESFGLVFLEALFAGIPIIYPAGAAIDGHFDGQEFALRVDARDPVSIAGAISHAYANEAGLKRAVRNWQRSTHSQKFTRPMIAEAFCEGLQTALRR